MRGLARRDAQGQVLGVQAVDGLGLALAEHGVGHDDLVGVHDRAHEQHAHGAAVQQGHVVREGVPVVEFLDDAHAQALVAAQEVAHAQNQDIFPYAHARFRYTNFK